MMSDTRALSRLSSGCKRCRYVETCDHKQMEALSYIAPATSNVSLPITQPILKKHDLREIKLDTDTTVTIDLEEMKEQAKKDFYKGLMKFGA